MTPKGRQQLFGIILTLIWLMALGVTATMSYKVGHAMAYMEMFTPSTEERPPSEPKRERPTQEDW